MTISDTIETLKSYKKNEKFGCARKFSVAIEIKFDNTNSINFEDIHKDLYIMDKAGFSEELKSYFIFSIILYAQDPKHKGLNLPDFMQEINKIGNLYLENPKESLGEIYQDFYTGFAQQRNNHLATVFNEANQRLGLPLSPDENSSSRSRYYDPNNQVHNYPAFNFSVDKTSTSNSS